MDTQEKEKKSEEIAAQTNQTKEQPIPAQPSDAESKKEKAKVEAELNKGCCLLYTSICLSDFFNDFKTI